MQNARSFSLCLSFVLGCSLLFFSSCFPLDATIPASTSPSQIASSGVAPQIPPPGQTLLIYKAAGGVAHVRWSPDGKLLASAGIGTPMSIWDARTGQNIRTITALNNNGITSIAWSHDGKRLAVGTWQAMGPGYAQVFEVATGKTLLTYRGHQGTNAVNGVAWSPDDRLIASSGMDGTMQIWESRTGNLLKTVRSRYPVIDVGPVAWSPDGSLIAMTSTNSTTLAEVQVVDVTGQTVAVYQGHRALVNSLAWTPDSKLLVSGSNDKTVQIWEARSGKTLLTYKGQSDSVVGVALSPDGKRVVSASLDKSAQEFAVGTGKSLLIYKVHSDAVYDVSWSPDGSAIASASTDSTVRVWVPASL